MRGIKLAGQIVEELKLFSEAREAAEQAFTYELLPWIAGEVEDLLKKDLDKKMLGVQKGKFPVSRMEHGVLRYKPNDKTDAEFLKEVVEYYLAWRSNVKTAIQNR